MTRPPPEQRPTARQLAAQSAGADPWACPRCGCRGPHKVVNSYETGGERKRRRVCRNCNQLIRTVEVPVPDGCQVRVVNDEEDEPRIVQRIA